MYYVGSRVGTYIAQGVYTVSGPFHPFGGAVDIIVVEQADGTFKSSPWYVKFGKFQGVLKSNEKSVAVAVNGGDAGFHMHLDHKGEAFLLRDAASAAGEDDDAAAVSPTEGASSGDEGSSHALRLALGRGEGERGAQGDRGKVAESMDDIELRFEGREASKQLIQRSVEEERRKVAAAREEIPDRSSDAAPEEIPERSSDAAPDGSGSRGETGRGKIAQAMLNGAVNLESTQRSTPARAILANAALAALGGVPLSDATCPDDASPSPKALKPEDRNGMLIHHLLNQAIGHRSGPAVALICSAALTSLRRVVSDPLSNSPSAGTSSQPDQSEPSVVLARPLDDTGGPGKVEIVDPNHKEVLVLDFTSELPVAVDALASNGSPSEDIRLVKSASSKENDIDEGESRGSFSEGAPRGRDLDPCDVAAELEVRKVKILEDKLIVEVGEKVEILRDDSRAKSGIPEKCDILRSFEIDRLEMADAVHTQLGLSSQGKPARGSEITNTLEQDAAPEEVDDTEIHINVAKHLVEKLNDALSQDNVNRSSAILTEEIGIAGAHAEPSQVAFETPEISGSARADSKETTDVSNKEVVMNLDGGRDPNLPLGSVEEQLPATATETATVSTEAKNACKPVRTTADDERALEGPVSLTDVSSPRRRAALEVEIAWRDVMEKAATTLKSTPFTSKNVNHSPSYKKMGSNISDGGEKKSDGVDGQSERKTWGTWFFGGGSATQAKQNGEQNGAKGRKGSSTESKDPKVGRNEQGSPSRTMTESEDVAKSNTLSKRNVVQFETSDVNVEPDGGGIQGDNYSGTTEDKKQGDESPVLKGKVGDQSGKAPDYKTQQRAQLPPRRRSIFGLLSRSNTNQSSLSSASLVQSDDGAQSAAESMRRETSLERAENVVDLLDEKWATGLDSPRRALAIASVLESGSVSNLFLDGTVKSEISGNNDGGPLNVDGVDSLVPANDRGEQVSAIELVPLPAVEASSELATPVDINSNQTTEDLPEAEAKAVSADIHQAENRSVADGVDEGVAIPSVSGTGPDEYNSTTKAKDMVLLSVNGCYVTAPLVDSADLQQSGEKLEKTSDDGEEIKRAAKGPSHRIISFTNSSEGNSVVSTGGNHSASIQVPVLQGGEGLTRPDHMQKQLDRRGPYDGMDAIGVGSDHGLKGLASLMVLDNVGSPSSPSQKTSSYPHDHRDIRLKNSQDSARMSERWLAAEVGHLPGNIADSNHPDDVKDIQSNETETLLEADDEETQSRRQLEGYFYPKNPPSSGTNEGRRVFKRNETFYMDALSGEDETDANDLTQDSPDQSRGKSVPIQIQGAVERDLISPSSHDMLSQAQTLRSLSESLPDRRDMEGLQMASPRLTLSRSLDSALSSVMIPESREPTSLSSDMFAMPDGRSIALAERTAQEGTRQLEQGSESKHGHIPSGRTNAATLKDQPAGPLTGFELSRCRHLLTARMGLEAASRAFASEMVALDDFRKAGSTVATDDKLVVRVGGRYYPWVVAAPIVLGILAFGQVLVAPEEGAIDVEQPIVNASAGSLTSAPSGAWKLPLWPFGGSRRPKTPEKGTPEKGNAGGKASREALLRATEAALKRRLSKEYLRSAGYYKRPRKVRTNSPSSQQLASLNLKEGSNKITFTFVTRMLGKQQVHARIYLWKWNTRIVISDVDGTITKSDVLGQVMPLVGKDWTQSGVARLFSAIKQNGYELMFLSARAISQAYLTRQFLENIKQDGEVLPDGPVVISPDGLFPSLYREVIRRVPHEFKIACLEDIKSLFPPESRPFYAGFGNRDTDELSYLKVGISKGKIFIINPKGEVVVNNRVDVKSYTSLHKLVDDMFPAVTFTEQEEYNEWNFWKLPLPDIDDELSVKSAGSSSSRRGAKSARHS